MALRILVESLLCGFPILFLFLSLYQFSSWKINMFRWGMAIFTFSEPFPVKIPKHLTNRTIEYKGLTFNFVSQRLGLFQSKIIRRRLNPPPISNVFPLKGEMIFGEAGDAKVILRIPYSVILLFICTVISVIGLTVLSKNIKADFLSTVIGTCLITLFVAFWSYAEKTQLENGIQIIKEYVFENMQ
jgi:hypothetical protein